MRNANARFMSDGWIAEWRHDLARELSQSWSEEARERAWQAIAQPLTSGDEPAPEAPPAAPLDAPPVSPHAGALLELAGLGHEFAFELDGAHSERPEIAERLESLRADYRKWLEQRRQGLDQLRAVAGELELLQRRVQAEASIGRGGPEAVRLRLERWL